jgi:hypothetical protein
MHLTISFLTGRAAPQLDWMLASLIPQLVADDEIEVLVIDMLGRSPEDLGTSSCPCRNVRVRVELSKPTAWQGKHRVTSCDWWAKSSSMNTAFVLCDTDYVAFVDDCCRLGPRWMETVRRGESSRNSVLAGTYDKIERGRVSHDHRRLLSPSGKPNCGGGWLYGCTFALPLAWALEANGAEEGCDGMGTEDYIFGFMLENNGHSIDFVPDLAVVQERPENATPGIPSISLRRTDKGTSPHDKSHAALARFKGRTSTEFSPDLRALRALRAAGQLTWPLPDPDLRDWYDGQLVREMI